MRNLSNPLTAILFSGLLFMVAGCTEQPTDPGLELTSETQNSPMNIMQEEGVGQDDISTPREVIVDGTFIISLESNPTTGYSWQAEFDAEFLELVNEDFSSDSALLGAGGIQKFEFLALKQGQVDVTMIYKRPWEEESIDKKVVPIKIVSAEK